MGPNIPCEVVRYELGGILITSSQSPVCIDNESIAFDLIGAIAEPLVFFACGESALMEPTKQCLQENWRLLGASGNGRIFGTDEEAGMSMWRRSPSTV